MRALTAPLLALLFAALADPALAAAPHSAVPARAQELDIVRRVDANQLNMWVTNFGSFAWDLWTGDPGFEYPRGSGHTVLFVSGIWFGATVNGEVRAVVAEYSQEYGPGPMGGGTFADPLDPAFRVYKVARFAGNPLDTMHFENPTPIALGDPLVHHGWGEYMAGAAPYGAPTRVHRLPDPASPGDSVDVIGPDVRGDLTLWAVYNDADLSRHNNDAGNSAPLGLEIQQTTWAHNQPGVLGNTVLIEFRIINKGFNQLANVYVAPWSDPDLGGAADDLAGCDTTLALGYVYNGTNNDLQYGASPPAVGYVLLQGPRDPHGTALGMTAFATFINGTDPAAAFETYRYMQGLQPDGSPILDPTTNAETRYMHSGDPVQGTGWIDASPSDKRMLPVSGPFVMAPGDTQIVRYAIVVGQGSDRLTSVIQLKQAAYELRTGEPPPPPPPVATNCPRDAQYWADQCAPAGAELDPGDVAALASQVSAQSLLFDWPPASARDRFCDVVAPGPGADVRAQAKREFAALLANFHAGVLGIVPPGGTPIRLLASTPISCPGLPALNIAQLVGPATAATTLAGAEYLNDNPTNRRPFTGVNAGLPAFFGGAGTMDEFFGSSINPVAHPDSFVNVEIRFSETATQQAYRYLRLETATGASPPSGREFRYGGFHPVPFQAWDVDHDVQLDVAFVERTLTDGFGTIQPAALQPAVHDSTWRLPPDDLSLGGREYLIVSIRPYSGTPKPEFMVDGFVFNGTFPGLYALWATLRSAGDVIDDGDHFRFYWSPFSGPGADTHLMRLESASLANPATQQAYQELAQCLAGINAGVGLENPCDLPTAITLALVSTVVDPGRVSLEWFSSHAGLMAAVERRGPSGAWSRMASVQADGSGLLRFEDGTIEGGRRYGYRLAFLDEGALRYAGEIWVDVPSQYRLALEGFVPNPATHDARVEFTLPNRDPARFEMFDLAGRRIESQEIGHLGPGRVALPFGRAGTLRPGVYVLTLTQGDATVSRRAVVMR